jgi:hypothetical protein
VPTDVVPQAARPTKLAKAGKGALAERGAPCGGALLLSETRRRMLTWCSGGSHCAYNGHTISTTRWDRSERDRCNHFGWLCMAVGCQREPHISVPAVATQGLRARTIAEHCAPPLYPWHWSDMQTLVLHACSSHGSQAGSNPAPAALGVVYRLRITQIGPFILNGHLIIAL